MNAPVRDPNAPLEEFDEGERLIAFEEARERAGESLKKEAIEQYEAKVENRAPIREGPAPAEVVAGIEIPQVTPELAPEIIEHIPVDASQPMNGTAAKQGNQYYKTVSRPNPDYVSPEDRAAAIVRAEKALEAQKQQIEANVQAQQQRAPAFQMGAPQDAPTVQPPAQPGAPVNLMGHMQQIQILLEGRYTVTGFQMINNQLVLTLE